MGRVDIRGKFLKQSLFLERVNKGSALHGKQRHDTDDGHQKANDFGSPF